MSNSLAPAFLKLRYTANGHPHVMTLPTKLVAGFTPGTEPILDAYGSIETALGDAGASLANLIKPFYHTADTFDLIECYSQPTPSDDPVFIFAVTLGIHGTNSAADTPAVEDVMTFRTAHKGGFKLYMMESTTAPNYTQAAPFTPSSASDDLASFLTGDLSFVYARNNDKLLVPLREVSKINDVLRRKYLTG